MKLKTKVKPNREMSKDYPVHLIDHGDGNLILRIEDPAGSAAFTWSLNTLLGLSEWSNGGPSDILSLDSGQDWHVSGMLTVYKEILGLIEVV